MNKRDIVILSAKEAGVKQNDARKVIDAFLKNASDAIRKEETATLLGFGVFSVKTRPDRNGYNSITGKAIKIAERKIVKFNPSKSISVKVRQVTLIGI